MFEVYSVLWDGGNPFIKTYVGINSEGGGVHHALRPTLEMGPDDSEVGLRQTADWMENADVSKVLAIRKLPGLSEMARNAISKDATAAFGGKPSMPPKATHPLVAIKMNKESEVHNLFLQWHGSMRPGNQ